MGQPFQFVSKTRSLLMLEAAKTSKKTGVWKVGKKHIQDMLVHASDKTMLTMQENFNREYKQWAAGPFGAFWTTVTEYLQPEG